jgi:hypothetical protein
MADLSLQSFLDRQFVFSDRPRSVPGDMRAVWRIPVILLLVRSCRGEKATHEQLHVLSWALRASEGPGTLLQFVDGQLRPEQAVVRFEPALDRGISLAEGFGLLTRQGRYWSLSGSGKSLLKMVDLDPDLLVAERAVLGALDGKLTQAAVQKMLRRS